MNERHVSRDESGPVILLTGAAGFLGQAIVRELMKPDGPMAGWRELRLLDVVLPGNDGIAREERIVWTSGDVRDPDAMSRACDGVDVVIHCAAVIDWGQRPDEEVESVNVGGVDAMIRACRGAGVGALVHTSTLDVVYTGRPIVDADESLPYPEQHADVYCRSKAKGERAVLEADGASLDGRRGRLRTTVLRPCCIWGEGDPYHAASLIELARLGPVIRIGDGSSRCQHVYVGNVAHAHVVAARALLDGRAGVGGEAFFVTDFPARNFFDYMEPIVLGAGGQMVPWALSLPRSLMYGVGVAAETAARWLRPIHRFSPTLSRFAVDFVCQDFTVSGKKAEDVLGYAPIYSEVEAFERTVEHEVRRAYSGTVLRS